MNLKKLIKLLNVDIKKDTIILNTKIELYNKKIEKWIINSITITFKFAFVIFVFDIIVLRALLDNSVYWLIEYIKAYEFFDFDPEYPRYKLIEYISVFES